MIQVTAVGYLTADPELKTTKSGKQLCNFRIAARGDRKDETVFFDAEAWDSGADMIAQYFKKGDFIILTSCSLYEDTWNDKEGNKRSKLRLRVRQFDFPGKSGGSGPRETREPALAGVGADASEAPADDIPF